MKKVAVASNNKHKIEEIRAILAGIYGDEIEVKSLSEIGFSGDIVEDGDTFEANAEIKARAAAKLGYIDSRRFGALRRRAGRRSRGLFREICGRALRR